LSDEKLKVLSDFIKVVITALSFHGIFTVNKGVILPLVGWGDESEFLARTISGGCATAVVALIETLNIRYGSRSKVMAKLRRGTCKIRDLLDLIFPYWALSKYLPIADKQLASIIAAAIVAPLSIRCLFTNSGYGVTNPKIRLVAEIVGNCDTELGNFPLVGRAMYHARRQSARTLPLYTTNKTEFEKLFDQKINDGCFHLNKYAGVDIFLNGLKVSGIMTYGIFIGASIAETELSLLLNFGISMAGFASGAYVGYKVAAAEDRLLAVCTSDFYRAPGLQEKIHDLIGNLCSQLIFIARYFDNPIDALKILLSVFIGAMFVYASFIPSRANEDVDVPFSYIWSNLVCSTLLAFKYFYDIYTQEKQILYQSGADERLRLLKQQRLDRQKSSRVEEVLESDAKTVTPSVRIQLVAEDSSKEPKNPSTPKTKPKTAEETTGGTQPVPLVSGAQPSLNGGESPDGSVHSSPTPDGSPEGSPPKGKELEGSDLREALSVSAPPGHVIDVTSGKVAVPATKQPPVESKKHRHRGKKSHNYDPKLFGDRELKASLLDNAEEPKDSGSPRSREVDTVVPVHPVPSEVQNTQNIQNSSNIRTFNSEDIREEPLLTNPTPTAPAYSWYDPRRLGGFVMSFFGRSGAGKAEDEERAENGQNSHQELSSFVTAGSAKEI